MMLVTLEAAKADLQMDHDQDDADIESKIEQASAIALNYLGQGQDLYADSTGVIPEDANGAPDVPYEVRAATLLMVRMLYKGEGDFTEWEHGYPPRAVMNLLYPLRTPSMG
jgi:hypothetical protein